MKKNIKIAVVGAGPAGLTAAYELIKQGCNVDVYEASNSVGGMAKTIRLWGQYVDLGPHRFFSSDPRVNELWLEMAEGNYAMVSRLTRIYYRKNFFDYPLKAFNALFGLGVIQSVSCILSYLRSKIKPTKSDKTFEEWVVNRFGEKLFKIFFKSYSEKLWGISCRDLDADFAAQRIKKLSLYEAVKSALFASGRKKHKTLVDEFAYPNKGAGYVYEKMAAKIMELGGRVHLNTSVESVIPNDSQSNVTVNLFGGDSQLYDHVISTMPITNLVKKLPALPLKIEKHVSRLKFRNTLLVYLRVSGASPFPDQWIYVHSEDLRTGRITNFSNWVEGIRNGSKDTILCLEYWCYDQDDIWVMDSEHLIALATSEIYKTQLVPEGSVIDGEVVRVPKCYPVYRAGYKNDLIPVEQFLSKINTLTVIGRYGSFKYNNQDHSILMGILASKNLAQGECNNLWDVNTDYEYQESSRITATGLSKD